MGFLPADLTETREVEIEILGERRKARRIDGPLWDADGARMRG
jgi:dimethylglycine dehydrogenase